MKEKDENKTAYDWCVEYNIRPLDLNEWPETWYHSKERHFYEVKINSDNFLGLIKHCTVKSNSTPRLTEPYLEYRMYGIVPYNISSIQSAIQYGHAVQEYNNMMGDSLVIYDSEEFGLARIGFDKWRLDDKTFIILNGGTTNEDIESKWYGSMQMYRDTLVDNGIVCAEFKEPDLNNTLTAVVFLVDERVFNREKYPNFEKEVLPWSKNKPSDKKIKELEERNAINYEKWVEKIGGPRNAFLREFLPKLKLAN
jgi:hypothetical protein